MIKTGISLFDEKFGQFKNGQLILFCGGPLSGKVTTALNIIKNNALMFDKKIAFFSTMYVKHILNIFDESKNHRLCQMILNNQIYINDKCDVSLNQIKNECLKLKKNNKLDLLVIDSFTNLESKESIKKILYFKNLAIELEIPILLLSSAYSFKNDYSHSLMDLKISYSDIIYSADEIIIFKTDYYKDIHKHNKSIEANIVKNKNGELGIISLDFSDEYLLL